MRPWRAVTEWAVALRRRLEASDSTVAAVRPGGGGGDSQTATPRASDGADDDLAWQHIETPTPVDAPVAPAAPSAGACTRPLFSSA